jgi:hypothetical protein
MPFKRTEIIEKITTNLAFLSKATSLENVVGLLNSNRTAQTFFQGLFNQVMDLNLVDLDIENNTTNYPGIDLGDHDKHLAIQITTDSSSTKIKDTINTFQNNPKCAEFSRLIIFIIGNKEGYTTNFITNGRFNFNPDTDIWDDSVLATEINKIQDINKLQILLAFLEEWLSPIMFPEILIDEDIKNCISILKRDFGSTQQINMIIESRKDNDFIVKKNSTNNISWDFFKNVISRHLKYNDQIIKFLSDPINKLSQNEYFEVTQAIQDYYHAQNQPYSFENIFKAVFSKINTYSDSMPGIDIKLKIMLHNMYFNCDIGDNPK